MSMCKYSSHFYLKKKNMKRNRIMFMLLSSMLVVMLHAQNTLVKDGIQYQILSSEEHTLAVVEYKDAEADTSYYIGTIDIPAVVLHEDVEWRVTKIEGSAFFRTKITNVVIPEGVTYIGGRAFQECYRLESVSLPSTLTDLKGHGTFQGCGALKSIVIPEGVKVIEGYVFISCGNLESISLPEGVTEIQENAFGGCHSLTSINLPDSLQKIGKDAFSGCYGLASLEIPEKVQEIQGGAFSSCSGLKSLIIRGDIDSIGNSVFSNCKSLETVTMYAALPPALGTTPFNGLPTSAVLRVPCGSLDAYHINTVWQESFSVIEERPAFLFQVLSEDESKGSVSVIQEPGCETDAIIKAIPQEGFQFKNWSDGVTDAERAVSLVCDTVLVAYFEVAGPTTLLPDGNTVAMSFFVIGNTLHVTGTTDEVFVYSLAGQQIYRGLSREIVLPQGMYIVNVGELKSKVLVQY